MDTVIRFTTAGKKINLKCPETWTLIRWNAEMSKCRKKRKLTSTAFSVSGIPSEIRAARLQSTSLSESSVSRLWCIIDESHKPRKAHPPRVFERDRMNAKRTFATAENSNLLFFYFKSTGNFSVCNFIFLNTEFSVI